MNTRASSTTETSAAEDRAFDLSWENEPPGMREDAIARYYFDAGAALTRTAATAAQEAPDMRDAYEGAREDLAIWKRRALEAERDIREERERCSRLVDELNAESGPTHMGEPTTARTGEQALNSRRYEYLRRGSDCDFDFWDRLWSLHGDAFDAAVDAEAGKSLVGLGQSHLAAAPDVDQRVPVPATDAQKVAPLRVDLGCDGAEQHLKAAGSALPHGGAPVEDDDRTVATAGAGEPTDRHVLVAKIRALVTGIAEQQAMPDDWWKPHLAEILAALAQPAVKESEKKEGEAS